MKLCFISRELYPFYYGGIGTQVYAQINFLCHQDNYQIYLITERPENFDETEFNSKYSDKVKVIFIDRYDSFSLHDDLNYAFSVERTFNQLYSQDKPDLLLLADFQAEGLFILLKREAGAYQDVPCLMTLHSPLWECLKFDAAQPENFFDSVSTAAKLTCYMENIAIQLVDYFAAPSKKIWQEISSRLSLKSEGRIIPNSVIEENFGNGQFVSEKIQEKKKIVYAGKLQKLKGVDILLHSFLLLLNEKPDLDVELICLGRDIFWEEYNDSFQAYWQTKLPGQIEAKVKFLGHVSQTTLRQYFNRAWVCVFPSRWESFGLVALEAIACGSPVIVAGDTGLQEVIGNDCGISFSLEEGTESLKSALEKVLLNPELRDELALQSRHRAEKILPQGKQLILEYIDYIQQDFSEKFVSQLDINIQNLFFLGQEYDKLCREQIENNQLEKQLEKDNSAKLWRELCQYKQELEQAQTDLRKAAILKQELERSQADLQAEGQKSADLWAEVCQYKQNLEQLQSQFQQAESKTVSLQTQLDERKQQLERSQTTITEMQSSNFWKLRQQWLKLKQTFGLGKSE